MGHIYVLCPYPWASMDWPIQSTLDEVKHLNNTKLSLDGGGTYKYAQDIVISKRLIKENDYF